MPSKSEKSTDTSRQRIISFLQGVYDSIAETLPDVKDETCDFDTSAVTIDLPETNDPYAAALGSIHIPEATSNAGMSKVRKHKMSVEFNVSRKHAQEERFLPPGHIRDFWEQMKVSEELGANEKHVAFSTFWRVWHQEFPFLRFRSSSSHGQCGTCLRHKLIIRGLAGHLNARQQQINLYVEHLRSQYNDRLCYWQLRGSSRLRSPFDVLLIIDGMDQAKFAYPRSNVFASKELQGLSRPRAHITGCICHGRFVLMTVSPADLPKDANASIEIAAHALHLLSQDTDLRQMTISVQCDNTPREIKNNHCLRWLASLVAHGGSAH